MKKIVYAVLGFVAISIVLTWLWSKWGSAVYGDVLQLVGRPLYDMIGFEHARVIEGRLRYINMIPFIALVLVTPEITLTRRCLGLVLGLFVLLGSHLALNLTASVKFGHALPIVSALFSDATPFVLWLAVAYPALVRLIPSKSESIQ